MITNQDARKAELVLRVIDNVDCPILMYEFEKDIVRKALNLMMEVWRKQNENFNNTYFICCIPDSLDTV